MGVVFHILSTGGGAGASRVTRYIAERDQNLTREGPGPRPLFSHDREGLTYRRADRILDPEGGQPDKDDLIHFSVMIEEENFDTLGSNEKERQQRFRKVIREGMCGMAEQLNVQRLTWVAGIHRNSENPHAHIVMRKGAVERGTGRAIRIGRIRKVLLPHKHFVDGKEITVSGRIGDRFLQALEKQKAVHLKRDEEKMRAQAAWEHLVERLQSGRNESGRSSVQTAIVRTSDERFPAMRRRTSGLSIDASSIAVSWNANASIHDQDQGEFRIALGKQLEFSIRLTFAQVWYDRAVEHGETYRFKVVDQSTSEERKISELDVHRRAAARAQRLNPIERAAREQAIEIDLSRHRETLDHLAEAREAKITALGRDVGSLRGKLAKLEQNISRYYEMPNEKEMIPILSRSTLSELQDQAVRLNLPDTASELEKLRLSLAREYHASTRTDSEAATLAAQVNVAQADLLARTVRLENFDASVHLTMYEVAGERWSLGGLDKQIARRREDAKLIPKRAARLDLRSLARINYSAASREEAAFDVAHLMYVRGEVIREIERRRVPLITDRDLAREMVDVLNKANASEQHSRSTDCRPMLEPKYERHHINSLEASAEALRDSKLLREVHEWEKNASRADNEISWEGRAVAREIMAGISLEETKERLQHFLESKNVASLHLGNHRTGALRDVEARTITEYLARAIESSEQRDNRHTIKLAAREHHGRLVSQFEKAHDYHEAARELGSEAKDCEPKFTDKEKINLEIYAERQHDTTDRERYLELARGDSQSQEHDVAASRAR